MPESTPEADAYRAPNEAAAAFRRHIEETLWTTCFSDGETYWADWSDLTAEAMLYELANAMDWDAVPESYFVLMVEREVDIQDLPEEKRLALLDPAKNRDIFREGFEPEAEEDAAFSQEPAIRDTTRDLIVSIWLDAWPRAGAVVDFGLDSQAHYEALYYGVREGEITPEALDAALGNGQMLTALALSSPSNPHREIEFSTSWDVVLGRTAPDGSGGAGGDLGHDDEPVLTGTQAKALFAEWREDYAARDSTAQEPRLPSPSEIANGDEPQAQPGDSVAIGDGRDSDRDM